MTLKKSLVLFVVLVLAIGAALAGIPEQAQAAQGSKEKDVTKPVLIGKVDPKYPEEAKKEKVQGIVIMETVIGADGKVLDVTVKKSPDERLSKAAMEAVKQWTFQPGKDPNGKPVKVKADMTVNFRLQ